MKKLVVILLVMSPFFVFSQDTIYNTINWIPLEKAKEYAKKENKDILIFFYRKNCPYCDEMKKTTLKDTTIVDLINNNFYAVKIDSRTKDTIYYNGVKYSNQQPIEHGSTFRHDFFHEVARFKQKNQEVTTTPSIVLFSSKFEKINIFPGKQNKPLLLRRIKPYIK